MSEKRKLNILWTTSDPETASFMVLMYATNSLLRDWWDEVQVIIWGASSKLVATDETIQEKIKLAAHAGVKFTACVACARQLGTEDKLKEMDIEVISWGPPLTELLQAGAPLITI